MAGTHASNIRSQINEPSFKSKHVVLINVILSLDKYSDELFLCSTISIIQSADIQLFGFVICKLCRLFNPIVFYHPIRLQYKECEILSFSIYISKRIFRSVLWATYAFSDVFSSSFMLRYYIQSMVE